MTEIKRAIRVLIADDEAQVRDAYREILIDADMNGETAVFRNLRDAAVHQARRRSRSRESCPRRTRLSRRCSARARRRRLPRCATRSPRTTPLRWPFSTCGCLPGPDGVWAAARIRELDPAIEIVLCTAYSDVDPAEMGAIVPPEEKLSYLQKPFHPHEIRQMTISLASKWRAEHRIVKLAYFDALTGLPNREQSRNRLASALAAGKQDGRSVAVLYLDLDNFKRVNDTLGHAVGDELLCLVASRMRNSLRADDSADVDDHPSPRTNHIARLGGDEFIVILPGMRDPADAGRVAARLIAELQQPMHLAQHTLVVTPSIGVALYPDDGTDVDTLLRNADLAMYFAKRKGPGMHAYFNAAMNDAALHRFTLEAKLRGALERGEFTLELSAAVRREHGHGLRDGGAVALEVRRSRAGRARRIHPHCGRDRIDPVDRRVGAAHGVPPGEGLARPGTAGAAHGGERVGTAILAQGVSGAGGVHSRGDGDAAVDAGARDHGVGGHEGRGLGGTGTGAIEGARDTARDRRFRHRLLELRTAAKFRGGPAEDRSIVHDQPGRLQRRPGHRGRDHRDVADACASM